MSCRILVLSDNSFILTRFYEISKRAEFSNYDFEWAKSPKSDLVGLSVEGIFTLDLKDESHLKFVVENYDLVFSAHSKQLFPPFMVDRVRCINIHPGYNPYNRGWYPQVFAILNDLVFGATIHEIDYELDNGRIIARKLVDVDSFDTSLSLYRKVLDVEVELIEAYLLNIIQGNYEAVLPEESGNVYYKKDFIEICHLDLDEKLTLKDCIKKLRALSHGDFKNAFFVDEKTGKKIYVKIDFCVDGN